MGALLAVEAITAEARGTEGILLARHVM